MLFFALSGASLPQDEEGQCVLHGGQQLGLQVGEVEAELEEGGCYAGWILVGGSPRQAL